MIIAPTASRGEVKLDQDAPAIVGILGVRHVGVLSKDPAALAGFYCDVMGMKLVRQTQSDHGLGATAFLASRPDEEDHDVVLVASAAAAHTAFRVASLPDLLASYRNLKARGVETRCLNHIIALAVYFDDPEGHVIEVYWKTGRAFTSAYAEPIDLDLSEEQLQDEITRSA